MGIFPKGRGVYPHKPSQQQVVYHLYTVTPPGHGFYNITYMLYLLSKHTLHAVPLQTVATQTLTNIVTSVCSSQIELGVQDSFF